MPDSALVAVQVQQLQLSVINCIIPPFENEECRLLKIYYSLTSRNPRKIRQFWVGAS